MGPKLVPPPQQTSTAQPPETTGVTEQTENRKKGTGHPPKGAPHSVKRLQQPEAVVSRSSSVWWALTVGIIFNGWAGSSSCACVQLAASPSQQCSKIQAAVSKEPPQTNQQAYHNRMRPRLTYTTYLKTQHLCDRQLPLRAANK